MKISPVSAAAVLLGSLIFAGVTGCQNINPSTFSSVMPNPQPQVMERLNAFQTTTNPEALVQASDLVISFQIGPGEPPAGRKVLRTAKLKLWLAVLNAIDTRLDPDFDFSKLPDLSVAPPFEWGLPAGVDPRDIKNPVQRAQYQKEVAANQQKQANYALQKKLHKINSQDTVQIEMHIKAYYTTSPEDMAELNQLIDQTVNTEWRKAALRRFLSSREQPQRKIRPNF